MNSSEQRVLLNVGGVRFETTVSTLCALPNSLLGRMFSPDNVALRAPAADGAHFFDRSGRLFDHVLQVYRTGSLVVLPDEHPDAALLLDEYEFWQVGGDVRAAVHNAQAEQRQALIERVKAHRGDHWRAKESCEWIVSGDAANVWAEMLRTVLSVTLYEECLHFTICSAGVKVETAVNDGPCCYVFAPASMFDLLSIGGSGTIFYTFACSNSLSDLLCTASGSSWLINVRDTDNVQNKRAELSVCMFESSGQCVWHVSDQNVSSAENSTFFSYPTAFSAVRVDSKILQHATRFMCNSNVSNRTVFNFLLDPVQNRLLLEKVDRDGCLECQSSRCRCPDKPSAHVSTHVAALPHQQALFFQDFASGETCTVDCSTGSLCGMHILPWVWTQLIYWVRVPSTTTFCMSDYPDYTRLLVREYNGFSGAAICISLHEC